MASKKTTSDHIKKALIDNFGGAASDWKRRFKKKNEQGEWVRGFENVKSGQRCVAVVERDNVLRVFMERAVAEPQKQEQAINTQDTENQTTKTYSKEELATKGITAEFLIDQILNGDDYIEDICEEKGFDPDAVVKTLGAEFAQHFIFAYNGKDPVFGLPSWTITPRAYWESEGYLYDQHLPIDALLPETMGCSMEAVWDSRDEGSILEQAKDLLERGFIWEEDFQDFCVEHLDDEDIDEITTFTNDMKALLKSGNAPQPKTPKL